MKNVFSTTPKKKKGQILCKILPGANLPTIIINAIFVTFCSCMQLWSVLSLLKCFSVFCRSGSRIREISATPLQNSAFFLRVLLVLQHLILTHYKSFTSSKALLINPKLNLYSVQILQLLLSAFNTSLLHAWQNYLNSIIHFWLQISQQKNIFFYITWFYSTLMLLVQLFLSSKMNLILFKLW